MTFQSKFQCKCHPGFEVQSDGSCLDVNECLKSSSNPCDYGMKCVNTPGSYFCKANEVCQVDEADYYRKVKGYSRKQSVDYLILLRTDWN